MHLSGLLVAVTILIALSFDFINGFHDAANSIATVVSTRVLSPRLAVIWAAFFNFVAAFVFGTAVAKTIAGGLVDPHQATQYVILSALTGAIIWDLLTWWWGLPTSSSHALIGGLAGAAIARAGWHVLVREPKLHWPIIGTIPGLGEKWMATLIFIVLAPLIGLVIGLGLMVAVSWIFKSARAAHRGQAFPQTCSFSPPPLTVWAMAVMTRKKPWVSSPVRCWPAAILRLRNFLPDGEITSGTSSSAPTQLSRWARIWAAGASSIPWDQKSPSCGPSADSALKARAPSRFLFLPITAFPSAPRTPSPAQSSASDLPRVSLPCVGA